MPIFSTGNPETPLDESAPAVAIAPLAVSRSLSPAKTSEAGGFTTRFADESMASRLRHSLPHGKLEHRWEALVRLRQTRGILEANGRIVVFGTEDREVYKTSDGASLGFKAAHNGEVCVDAEHGLYWSGEAQGAIAARRLEDGARELFLMSYFGKGYARDLVCRRGDRLFALSREVPDHGRSKPPDLSVLELFDLGSPPKVGPSGFLDSGRKLGVLFTRTRPILVAISGETVVAAVPGRIYLFGLAALALERVLTGAFTPLALSVDEAGRIHAIVTAPDEDPPPDSTNPPPKQYLWVVQPTGERVFSVEVPASSAHRPPIVGYDHTVYVVVENKVLAFDSAGKPLWRQPFPRVGGAAATSCGKLLVSSGSDLVVMNLAGESTVIATLPGEVQGAAVITKSGEVVAATSNHLSLLAPA